jgi:hypothetical protein
MSMRLRRTLMHENGLSGIGYRVSGIGYFRVSLTV